VILKEIWDELQGVNKRKIRGSPPLVREKHMLDKEQRGQDAYKGRGYRRWRGAVAFGYR